MAHVLLVHLGLAHNRAAFLRSITLATMSIASVTTLAVVASTTPRAAQPAAFQNGSLPTAAGDPDAVSFNRDIRPILANACFKCHGPDAGAREAELRLDTREGATALLEGGGAPIVPGNSASSEMIARVSSDDDSFRMPPPDVHVRLDAGQVDLLRRWIDAGAVWERHWSFLSPKGTTRPVVRDKSWVRDPIDQFVLARLEPEGLKPAAEADRETLIRRVTFGLTGLPPTLEEIDTFVADSAPGAYERVVDRLLGSPHFGERMAVDWLDLARYADTYGYQSDVESAVWPWRDWVIGAFNSNLPYDEFVTWQLAGDLLPDATREQRLATAFNRLHRQTNEGGSVEEEYRVEYVSDRTQTFATAMLGLTVECARCHDHKFDPISQEEYYRLTAFFSNIDESGLYSHFTSATPTPTLALPTIEQERKIESLGAEVTEAEQSLAEMHVSQVAPFQSWLDATPDDPVITGLIGHYAFSSIEDGKTPNALDAENPAQLFDGPTLTAGRDGGSIRLSGDNGVRFPGVGTFARTDPFTLSLWIKSPDVKERAILLHRSRAWTDAASQGYQLLIEDGRLSWSLIHFWPGDAIRIRAVDEISIGQWVQITATYDGSSRADGLVLYIDGQRADVIVVRDNLHKAITGGGPGAPTLGQRFRDRGFSNGLVDDVRFFDRQLTAIEARHLFDERSLTDGVGVGENSPDVYEFYLANHDELYKSGLESLRSSRQALARVLDAVPEIMTMEEMREPRETYVLARGSYEAPGKRVRPGTPQNILAFADDLRTDRLGLAQWLTGSDNPLAARVAVNRLWQVVFGRGLVATPEDFGTQGSPPTHPELLDALALEFVDSGWDVKGMLRRMVLSSTYRQSSRMSEDAHEVDPLNVLLSRGPSGPLSAEMLRDQALMASGLLVDQIGGPSVFPYEPAGLWSEKSGKNYPQSTGESLYRRSLYTFWKRTSPPPAMMILDAAKRDVCVARRQTTGTPLQSLVVLNDPQFVEAARMLAQRVMRETDATEQSRVGLAFRLLTGRRPTEGESVILVQLYLEQQRDIASEPGLSQRILSVGDAPADESLDDSDLAALSLVCSMLMGHDAVMMAR